MKLQENMFGGMVTPNSRKELERSYFIWESRILRRIEAGEPIGPEAEAIKGLSLLSNSRLNLLTYNESLRVQANMMNTFDAFPNMFPGAMDNSKK